MFGAGGGEQLTAQNTESMHDKLSQHLDKSAVAHAAVDQLISDMQLVKEAIQLNDPVVQAVDSEKLKEDKRALFGSSA